MKLVRKKLENELAMGTEYWKECRMIAIDAGT